MHTGQKPCQGWLDWPDLLFAVPRVTPGIVGVLVMMSVSVHPEKPRTKTPHQVTISIAINDYFC